MGLLGGAAELLLRRGHSNSTVSAHATIEVHYCIFSGGGLYLNRKLLLDERKKSAMYTRWIKSVASSVKRKITQHKNWIPQDFWVKAGAPSPRKKFSYKYATSIVACVFCLPPKTVFRWDTYRAQVTTLKKKNMVEHLYRSMRSNAVWKYTGIHVFLCASCVLITLYYYGPS